VTGEPGINTAIAAGAEISGAANPAPAASPCPPARVLLTQVTACPNISRVTRPTTRVGDLVRPVCDGMSDAAYQQLVLFNIRGYALMNQARANIARRMTCLLGVAVSEAQITDGLAQLAQKLCDTSGSPTRLFSVTCGDSGMGAAASFSAGASDDPDYCGRIMFKPDVVTRIRDRERRLSGVPLGHPNYVTFASDYELAKQDLVDGIIHENTHALASLLRRAIPGASMDAPPNRSCSVGALTQTYTPLCNFYDGERNNARLTMVIGKSGFDHDNYRPFADVGLIDQELPRLRRTVSRGRAYAERLRSSSRRRMLNSAERAELETYDFSAAQLTRFESERACAVVDAQDPQYIYTDLDRPPGACAAVPSGRYRNEVTARSIARDIAGYGCVNARTTMFGPTGTP
jgi:hypothetical protein